MTKITTNVNLTKNQLLIAFNVAKANKIKAHQDRNDKREVIAKPEELISEYINYSVLSLNDEGISGFCTVQHHLDTVSFEDFLMAMVKPPKEFTFKLNDEYEAKCNPTSGTIKVGCQTFSINLIRNLVKEFDKVKKNT